MRALVLGLGDSGLAMARYLAARGHALRVADTRSAPPQLHQLRAELPAAEFSAGDFTPALLDDVQLIALSPGLSPIHSSVSKLLKTASRKKIEVVGEIELFARELARLKAEHGYAPQIVGITGTNGKTTTARLTGLIIEATRKRVEVAGNIGPVALDTLRTRIADEDWPDVWVLELSSFQLATTRSLRCDVATVLNIADNHLDWHGSFESYAAAKSRIFSARTVRVLNRDDSCVLAMAKSSSVVVTFGANAPTTGDSYGIIDDHGVEWLAWAEDNTVVARRRKSLDVQNDSAEDAAKSDSPERDLLLHRLMPVEALAIRGKHNALNALAALALARAIGCELAPMMHALRRYRGEPHRLQLIASVDGVEYYDDSKGTTVAATVAALEGLGDDGRKLVVILGGDGKGQAFSALAEPVSRYARAAVLIGRDAPQIRAALELAAVSLFDAASLDEAVRIAAEVARDGDAVLLSPACASLDMFRNYMQRGDVFVQAVRNLSVAVQSC